MPNIPMMDIPLPRTISEKEFERMCLDVLAQKYPDLDGFCLYGESGQLQEGIDICSKDPNAKGKYIVAQCKNYLKGNKEKRFKTQIEKDIQAARKLDLKIERFIAMTAIDNSPDLIKYFAELNEAIPDFKISVMFWGDITNIIRNTPNLLERYYEDLFSVITGKYEEKAKKSTEQVLRYTDDPNYMDKWTDRLWLFPQGKDITYATVYVKPEFSFSTDSPGARRPGEELEKFLTDFIQGISNKRGVHLILGNAGGGKSSLFLRLWNHPNLKSENIAYFSCRNLNKLFQNGTLNENSRNETIADTLLNTMLRENPDINRNTTILLDGFDELSISENVGKRVLSYLHRNLQFSRQVRGVLITCRRNFFSSLKNVLVPYLQLKSFSTKQMQEYVKRCHGTQTFEGMNPALAEIYGIPLILYMVTAFDFEVKENKKVVEVYDRLFDVENGVYHRSIQNTSGEEWEQYGFSHAQIAGIAGDIHKISQRIAYYMFEHEPNRMICPKEEIERYVEEICAVNDSDITYQKLLIGSFFQIHHTEGTENISFIHRSMYEYFTCVYVSEQITEFLYLSEYQVKEEIYGKLGNLFKYGFRTELMKDYLETKLHNVCSTVQNKSAVFHKWEKMLEYLLEHGMLDNPAPEKQVFLHQRLVMEANSLFHLLEITQILYKELEMNGFILKNSKTLIEYLPDFFRFPHENKPYHLEHFDLNNIYLRKLDLTRGEMDHCSMEGAILRNAHLHTTHLNDAKLSETDFFMADMRGCQLDGAKLTNTDMKEANLFEAQLNKAELISAQMDGANLRSARLREANLQDASLKNADLSGADLMKAKLKGANLENVIFDEEDGRIETFDFSEAYFDYLYIGKKRFSHDEIIMMQKGQNRE